MTSNKYLIAENEQNKLYTLKQCGRIKFNNFYIMRVLASIYYQVSNNNFWDGKLHNDFAEYVKAKKLPFNDPNIKQDEIALKLYAFTIFIKKQENVLYFKKSPFYRFLIIVLSGYTGKNQATEWSKFKKNDLKDNLSFGDDSLAAAFKCYYLDDEPAIKINMTEIFNALFIKTSDGNYIFRTDFTEQERAQLDEAAILFVKHLQSQERFKRNYYNEQRAYIEALENEY